MRRTLLLILLLLPAAVHQPAQGSAQSDEELHLHIDRGKYIAGENVWFSIYSTRISGGLLSEMSSVTYVEIINPWNNPVARGRFLMSDGRGNGCLQIPDTSSSGDYCIRAYTNAMKTSGPGSFFTKNIQVVNAFKGDRYTFRTNSSATPMVSLQGGLKRAEIPVKITCDTLPGRRQKVNVSIAGMTSGQSLAGYDLSVSVVPSETLSRASAPPLLSANKGEGNTEALLYENGSHYLRVRVIRNDPASASPEFVYLSIQGKIAWFDYAKPGPDGIYLFRLPVDSRERNLILQPDKVTEGMTIRVLPSFYEEYIESKYVNGNIPDSLYEVFNELSFNYQASRIYNLEYRKENPVNKINTTGRRRFYGIPEMEIRLDDYISLPSMQEVFYELLPGINFVNRKEGYRFLIANPLTGEFYAGSPLIMIDGVIINDLNIVADLDPEIVERIEVIRTPYVYGDLILYGIVNIITMHGDFSDVKMPDYAVLIPYKSVESSYLFVSPDYSSEKMRQSRVPDLRNTVYWNPSVRTNIDGTAEFEFYTSDNPGTYCINVMGYSPAEGIFSVSRIITVKR